MTVLIQTQHYTDCRIWVDVGNYEAGDQVGAEFRGLFRKFVFLDWTAVFYSHFVCFVLLALLQFRKQEMASRLVKLILLAKMEHQLPRLVKSKPQPNKYRNKRGLAVKHNILRQCLADSHGRPRPRSSLLLALLRRLLCNWIFDFGEKTFQALR